MTLIQKFLMVLAAMFVLGVAGQASAKTLTEIDACKDAALAAAPFTGTIAKREVQARHLDGTDFVVINGERVSATRPIWNLCEGPSLTEQLAAAKADLKASKGEVTRLTGVNTTLNDNLVASKTELRTAKAEIESEKFFGGLWLVLGLLVLAALVATLLKLMDVSEEHKRLQRRLDARQPAPPSGDEPSMASTLGKMNDGPTPAGAGAEG